MDLLTKRPITRPAIRSSAFSGELIKQSDVAGLPAANLLEAAYLKSLGPSLGGLVQDESPGNGTDRPRLAASARNFNGTTGRITTGYTTAIAAVSGSVWAKFTDTADAGNYRHLLSKGHVSKGSAYEFAIGYRDLASDPEIFLYWHNGTTNNVLSFVQVLDVTRWYHFAFSIEDGDQSLWIDGLKVGTDTLTSSISSSQIVVGGPETIVSSSQPWQGPIGDTQVFSEALTQDEVNDLFALQEAALPSKSRLMHFKHDDKHATLSLDSSGNGNDGTLANITDYSNADVPFDWRNEVGYTLDGSVYVPRDESSKGDDADGNPLAYSGRAPADARLIEATCGTFDGTADKLTLPASLSAGSGSFSISALVYATSLSGANGTLGKCVIKTNNGDVIGDFILGVNDTGRVCFANWREAGNDADGVARTTDTLSTGQWYHILCTWDGAVNKIYVDGVDKAFTTAGTSSGWGANHQIGESFTDAAYRWNGSIAYVDVYHAALTAADAVTLAAHHELSSAPAFSFPLSSGNRIWEAVSGSLVTQSIGDAAAFWTTRTQNGYHRNAKAGFSWLENSLVQSDDLEHASWVKTTTTVAAESGWFKVSKASDASSSSLTQANAITAAGDYVIQVECKAGEFTSFACALYDTDWAATEAEIVSGPGTVAIAAGMATVSGLTTATTVARIRCRATAGNRTLYFYAGGLGVATGNGDGYYLRQPQISTIAANLPLAAYKQPRYVGTVASRYALERVPAKNSMLDVTDEALTHPGGKWLTGSESKLDTTGGITFAGSAGWDSSIELGDILTNPEFARVRQGKLDRVLHYNRTVAGSRLTSVWNYTSSTPSQVTLVGSGLNLLVFGDSTSNDPTDWPGVLDAGAYTVQNHSASGRISHQIYDDFITNFSDVAAADRVIFGGGVNDAYWQLSLEHYQETLRKMRARIPYDKEFIVFAIYPFAGYSSTVPAMLVVRDEFNAWILGSDGPGSWTNTRVFDPSPIVDTDGDGFQEAGLTADGLHPNATGQTAISNALIAFF